MSDGGHGGGGHGKRRGHEEEHEEHENHERWLVSYADMMTLLMVLFIVMFAISQVDSKKFMALKNGLESGFGSPLSMLDGADDLLSVGGHVAPDSVNLAGRAGNKNADPNESQSDKGVTPQVNPDVVSDLVNKTNAAAVAKEVKTLKEAEEEMKKAAAAAGVAKNMSYRFNEQGLVVSIATDKVLFDSGGATLLPGGRKIIDALAPTLLKLPNNLIVNGHTDSNPIHTAQFPDNWALSSERANGVLRYLNSSHKIPVSRMYSSGFADTKPIKAGKTAAALDANRRVEIVIVAQIDNSLGKAVEKAGNTTAVDRTASPSPSTSPGASASATKTAESPEATPEATKTAPKTATKTATETETAPKTATGASPKASSGNILGLEPNTATG